MSDCPWDCDDDGHWPAGDATCWDEIEELAGPEYRMWLTKLDTERGTYRAPEQFIVMGSKWYPA